MPGAARVPADRPRDWIAHLLLFVSVGIWGSTFVAMKHLLGHVTPLELVGLRFGIGLPILAAIVLARRLPLAFERRDLRPLALGAAILLVHFLVQPLALSLRSSTATKAGWIIAFSPLWIAVLSRLVHGERLRARQAAGIAAATIGILLLVSGGKLSGLSWFQSAGDWLVFLTSFTWAAYTVATRDLARRRGALLVTLVLFVPLCLVGVGAIALAPDRARLVHLPPAAIASLLFLAVPATLAQWFWQLGVARLGAARAGLYVYLSPLATSALATTLLGEPFGPATAVGGLLVLAGVFWAQGAAPAARTKVAEGG